MAYIPFDATKPTTAQTRQAAITSILQNFLAARDSLIMGEFPGFNYSVSGGTADQPAIMYWTDGTECVKASLTWGNSGGTDGNPTVIVYAYAPTGGTGGTFVTIKTVTYAYDDNGNLTNTTWS